MKRTALTQSTGICVAALVACVLSLAHPARADYPSSVSCPSKLLKNGLGRVSLFSAIPLGDTDFAQTWAQVLPSLQKAYPDLEFTSPDDLHITVMYFGDGWDPSKIGEMAPYALLSPDLQEGPVNLTSSASIIGSQSQVVVLQLNDVPQEWTDRVIQGQTALDHLGLRKHDYYDGTFDSHITLVTAPNPSSQQDELSAVMNWVNANASGLSDLTFTFDDNLTADFLLSVSSSENSDQYQSLLSVCSPD
jgi:2'-5' RNA ligase